EPTEKVEKKPAEEKKEEPTEKVEEKPAEEKKEESAEKVEEKPAEKEKGSAKQPKSTKPQKPTECAACGKALRKKLWYYRNGAFYCTIKCYKRKVKEQSSGKE
ncbi:MAG: hypothetical protein KJ864_02320, partial [Candidatus Omnitrophica bacterium]|nr:hypothetical protein [Candidatus Omnitrophota bacterium]